VSAVLKLKVDDYYHNGARRRLRLHEKGGKEHDMPVHHLLEQILNEYIKAAGLQSGQPLFQSVNSTGMKVTGRALNRYNAWAAIRKRAKAAGFLTPISKSKSGFMLPPNVSCEKQRLPGAWTYVFRHRVLGEMPSGATYQMNIGPRTDHLNPLGKQFRKKKRIQGRTPR
jgi:hypothetical protein